MEHDSTNDYIYTHTDINKRKTRRNFSSNAPNLQTTQLKPTNLTIQQASYWYKVNTPQVKSVVKPEALLQIIFSFESKSDIKEIHGNTSKPLVVDSKVTGRSLCANTASQKYCIPKMVFYHEIGYSSFHNNRPTVTKYITVIWLCSSKWRTCYYWYSTRKFCNHMVRCALTLVLYMEDLRMYLHL